MTKATVVSLIMRVVMGIIFIVHGVSKLQMGLSNVDAWFGSIGIPGFLAYFVAALELVGGIMLILGLFTRYVSALFVIMLIGAIVTTKLSAGLVGNAQMPGFELELGFMLVSLYLVVADHSPFSVDRLFMNKRTA
ncbi:DoxX family protein [Paenibacillus aceris]|uniref:Membrane protein YphA (DoxX/SURF4 family) n=1 Tax=Paenibacillus aceris TaxID=869555 RepID=A0ABS4I1H2_9BACL|nr:DoxX family protein [Paenibacillus aceris]MBP1964266.1 putative membrane protein YphA (DoxX/SURF4 family) [Paenibacillus aceris]NHW36588.1 DoxX family protein [Paenibacillus aceris]